ncbi:HlyD family secretion protein [Spongiibacter sp. KMU-158]|uniref:HlyD family secretion protein n=1 Tax=Spongiibacter pelagi TaxID=2760804 RepID=A0A927GVG1_9GAMM|nr:HlyD family secretion protein [Spongiibacter pelagi]MBD2858631.1 HlyD family secretion protein [Spongiibacter pelagi]
MNLWKGLVLLLVLVGGVAGLYAYDHYSARYPSTENAYIDATSVQVSAAVAGPVVAVNTASQRRIDSGQLLLEIDPLPYKLALLKAQSRLDLARRDVAEREAAVAAARASVAEVKVRLSNADKHWQRLKGLKREKYMSDDALEAAEAAFYRAQADLQVVKAKLAQAEARQQQQGALDSQVVEAQANVEQAEWELEQTRIVAPCDGITDTVGVHKGETVVGYKALFNVVCDQDFWVEANFKETDLARIQPGQQVDVSVDMYTGHAFHGVVETISPAAGGVFSLLPPQNASANWVKVTQRVPVRIRITDADQHFPLRIGSSAHVRVDTGSQGI